MKLAIRHLATNRVRSLRRAGATDLALFYGRNNLLINGDVGWVPGNVFGAVVEGFDEMAAACNDLWRHGFAGERLTFARA